MLSPDLSLVKDNTVLKNRSPYNTKTEKESRVVKITHDVRYFMCSEKKGSRYRRM